MEEQNVSPANEPNADQRITELENKLADVNRRYAASSEEGKRLAQTVQYLQQAQATPRQEVPDRRRPWEQKLEESAIPIDAMMQAIDERAEALIQQRFQPLMQGVQARQKMVGQYKDYTKFEADIGEFINSDPEIQQTYNSIFQANPPAAFDWAYMKFGQSKRGRRTASESNNESSREEQSEAQIPTNRNGDARRIPQGHEAAIDEARRAYREQPNKANAERYAKLRLRTVITDEFLNQ